MSQTEERRVAARHPTVDNTIVLAWHNEDSRGCLEGRLVNISQSGALLLVEGVPPTQRDAWVRLVKPSATDWVESHVVSTTRRLLTRLTRKRTCLVRLRFLATCPYDLFKLATHGPMLDEACRESGTSEYESRIWR